MQRARQKVTAQTNQMVRNGNKRHGDDAQCKQDNSPISTLSPAQSSASSNSTAEFSHNDSSADSSFLSLKKTYASDMRYKLQELESVLMGPDIDDPDMAQLPRETGTAWVELLDGFLDAKEGPNLNKLAISEEACEHVVSSADTFTHPLITLNMGSSVKYLLVKCAAAISEGKMDVAELAMQDLRKTVSVYGDPLERLAAYMSEGLVARLHSSGSAIYQALKCREAPAVEVLSAWQKLSEICPYIQFAFVAANGAIAEALKDEPIVHIFDFQIDQGMQWFSLIHALATRPGGTPCIRISTVDDPTSHTYPLGGLLAVKNRLANLASSLGVPFEFTAISSKLCDLEGPMIERRPGEALAMNFALQLHHMPDESVCLDNPRDRILRMAKSLKPKVLTIIEADANTNTVPFLPRFMETLDYYGAFFESIDVALSRESRDRVHVEEHCLAKDIVNLIACEGEQRVERHELVGKWRARMRMAGFKSHPLSSHVNNAIRALLESFNHQYRLKEDGEALLLGWQDRSLLAASAWC